MRPTIRYQIEELHQRKYWPVGPALTTSAAARRKVAAYRKLGRKARIIRITTHREIIP